MTMRKCMVASRETRHQGHFRANATNLMNKKDLSERDVCSKFVGPAVKRASWDGMMQIRVKRSISPRDASSSGESLVTRGKAKRADYILYYKSNIPIAKRRVNSPRAGDSWANLVFWG